MYLKSELQKHIVTTYDNASATFGSVQLYFNHATQTTDYPFIVFNSVSNTNSQAFSGAEYLTSRIQFSIYGNEDQYSTLIDLSDKLENTFHRKTDINLNNSIRLICSKVMDTKIQFYNDNEKIWNITQDYKFELGN